MQGLSTISKRSLRFLLFSLTFILVGLGTVIAQTPDTSNVVNMEFITDQLENLAEKSDLDLDYSDLLEDYLYYARNPINLNGPDIQELRSIYLINDIQLNNLKKTIHEFGPMESVYELQNIPGFDEETIKNMLPFVEVGTTSIKKQLDFKKAFAYGSHQLLMRYDRVLEERAGYKIPIDSAIDHPGSAYLGSPDRYYARYAFNYKNLFRFGFTLDKDPGELVNKSKLPDTLQQMIGDKIGPGFDFFSAFAYAETKGIIKQVAIGDYHLEFGQGLTLWSGLSFGKSSEAIQLRKFGRGIKPNTSANENRFFRGAAVTFGYRNIQLTAFYSSNKVDSNIERDVVDQDEGVTSIMETGMHRTINELLDKRSLDITAYGAHISYQTGILQLGLTSYNTATGIPITPSGELYKQFNYTGNALTNYGADASVNLNKISFFGEVSMSSNGGKAGLVGINTFLSDRLTVTMLYHNYGKDYQNLYNNPFYESSSIANEQGIYIGLKALISRQLSLSGYIDHFRFPWLKYRVDAPSTGRDYLFQVTYTSIKPVTSYIRIRFKDKQENEILPYDYTKKIAEVVRNEFRFFISYQIWPTITFKNRIDMVFFQKEFNPSENGYMIFQDILFRPKEFPVELTFRYALFGTDGYDSRIYSYENDVLYAFSVPSYFGDGQRIYLMARWKINNSIDFWLRVARTTYFNQNTISSGAEEIIGNHKTEIKAQVKIKL